MNLKKKNQYWCFALFERDTNLISNQCVKTSVFGWLKSVLKNQKI